MGRDAETDLRVSVVIPSWNRSVQLHACLQALAASFAPDAEVIVVADGGAPPAFPGLSALAERLNLRLLHVPHGGPAQARNRGLQIARGAVVAFIDDDCLPEPQWLERLAAAVSQDPPIAAGGRTQNGSPSNPYAEASQLVLDMAAMDQQRCKHGPSFFPSNNLAFPTEVLRRLGGFNPAFRTAEDRELCRRWLRAGHKLVSAPEAVVAHFPVLNLAGFWRKCSAYGKGAAQFHAGSGSQSRRRSLAFHLRVPHLAMRLTAGKRLRRRVALAALLLLWEAANLAGYLKERWRHQRHKRWGVGPIEAQS